jgi:hypothetical protein
MNATTAAAARQLLAALAQDHQARHEALTLFPWLAHLQDHLEEATAQEGAE